MKRSSNYFKMYSQYGLEGYYIPVRNTFNNCIEREFIPVGARELYETRFGEDVVTDHEFLDWYSANSKTFI